MHAPHPARLPQRVVVTGPTGPALDAFAVRVALALDLPAVGAADLGAPGAAERLAAFEGWLLVVVDDAPPAVVLDRAELVVHAVPEARGALRGLVRRAKRRLLADAADEAPAWFAAVEAQRSPDVARLDGPDEVEEWLTTLAR
ncbi:hypothetical protein [Nocardioides sp.]|uniref:hypothetical protein n=1 Tax=Nocardioides sp. TaxID=35761 RepID=UPI0035150FC3